MATWIKIRLIEKPFYDLRTGEVLPSINGRQNRLGIDPFEGGGKVYPPKAVMSLNIISRHESGDTLMLLVDECLEVINIVLTLSGSENYQASPTIMQSYDLADFDPKQLTNNEALAVLINEIGLPADTTMDENGYPIIPDIR